MKKKYIYILLIFSLLILVLGTWGWYRVFNYKKYIADQDMEERTTDSVEISLNDIIDDSHKENTDKKSPNEEASSENTELDTEDNTEVNIEDNREVEEEEVKENDDNDKGNNIKTVDVIYLNRQDIYQEKSYEGILEPTSTRYVSPQIPGRVEKIYVDVGDRVEKGDLLLEIDSSEIKERLKQAESAVRAAKAQLELAKDGARDEEIKQLEEQLKQAELNLEYADDTYQRSKKLYEEDIIPRQEFDSIKIQKEEAESMIAAAREQLEMARSGAQEEEITMAEAELQQAKADLEIAEKNLEDTKVEAHGKGIIAVRELEEGEIVSEQNPPLVIINTDPIKTVFDVGEKDLTNLAEDQDAIITVDAFPEREFSGVISSIHPMADSENRLFPIEIEIENPDLELKAGMFARLKVDTPVFENKLLIPQSSVIKEEDQEKVYLVEDNVLVSREIDTGGDWNKWIEVVKGIEVGEMLVLNPTDDFFNGMEVEYDLQEVDLQ